ncbi:uncharacterized protein C8A04DRAFT_29888 [Dichotomopilus funicola]|uniref:Uncharacterized protein n=1 Tax=Dichotomopilus funicola TaxID=1934379 RepID=A0AAN6V1P0_9PEZI|nr:hypothetical protein C8A04DRAFT_29888 [Dichotomopilus funicola]
MASQSKLWLALPKRKQDRQCDLDVGLPPEIGVATLFMQDDELFLYGGKDNNSHQQLAVDVEATGPNGLKYFDNTSSTPGDSFQTKGWVRNWDTVSFSGAPFVACPAGDGRVEPKDTPAERTPPTFHLFEGEWYKARSLLVSKGRLWLTQLDFHLDQQCTGDLVPGDLVPGDGAAILFVKDSQLFLYGGETGSNQQFAVDVEATGRGNLKYFNNTGEAPGKPWTTKGFVQGLQCGSFANYKFFACPETDGFYSVDVLLPTTILDKSCLTFPAQPIPEGTSLGCEYSTQ